jgi:hypothetical protein
MSIDLDLLDDGLSSAMATETLLAYDLVLDGLLASSRGPDTPYWRDKIPGIIPVTERFDLKGALSCPGIQIFGVKTLK